MADSQVQKKPKILILSYYWPPGGGAGVQRWVKFAKYLHEMGYGVFVVTPKDPSVPFMDPTLDREVPKEVKVIRTRSREPFAMFNLLRGKKGNQMGAGTTDLMTGGIMKRLALYIRSNYFIPDARMGWNPFAEKAASQLIEEEKIDIIVSTGPPHSTHLVAERLQRKYSLPWICDFRDPWTSIYYLKLFPLTRKSWKKHHKLEDGVLKNADLVTTISNDLGDELSRHSSNVSILYNGYDDADFKDLRNVSRGSMDRIKLRYVGNFKPNQNYSGFFELIHKAMERHSKLELEFVGPIDGRIREELENSALNKRIKTRGPVDHKTAVDLMVDSDILLFVIPRGENEKGIITGKIYEYMATKKPILAIGPTDGDAAEILKESGAPFPMIGYSDLNEGLEMLNSIVSNIGTGQSRYSYDGLTKFSRKSQTLVLSDLIKKTLNA